MDEPFSVAALIAKSRSLDLSGIDWAAAAAHPVSGAELRLLPYFIDVESYTIGYLRALLNTSAIQDPEIADFLPVWAYEEGFHGRALERFLAEAGHGLDPKRPRSIQRPRRFLEGLQDLAASGVSKLFAGDFPAVHMTWGAINELTTLNGYRRLAARTRNPVLAEVVRRIMRDESRHFSFYYHKAEERLRRSHLARRLAAGLIRRFWKPVGAGIMPEAEVDFVMAYVFGGPDGAAEARHVDETIARLPAMGWFTGLTLSVRASLRRLGPIKGPESPAALAA